MRRIRISVCRRSAILLFSLLSVAFFLEALIDLEALIGEADVAAERTAGTTPARFLPDPVSRFT